MKKKYKWFLVDLFHLMNKRYLPIRYYSRKLNVGDSLNPYLISKLSGRSVYEVKSGCFSHILGIGSIIHYATDKSLVWGSGVIDPAYLPNQKALSHMRVIALRGKMSQTLLLSKGANANSCLFGDPAVLMPHVHVPDESKQEYAIGFIPHLADLALPVVDTLVARRDVALINVADSVENVISQIVRCECIASSSLHGLILADAYGVPNVWVKFSDRIIGGDFKFLDYYSTTDNRNPSCVCIDESETDTVLKSVKTLSRINNFIHDKDMLARSLPTML